MLSFCDENGNVRVEIPQDEVSALIKMIDYFKSFLDFSCDEVD